MTTTRRPAGRAVFATNGVVSLALVVVVAGVALVVNPPAPPGIAAFAPQASKPIVKAPPGQSSTAGLGKGRCASGQVCTGPSGRPSAKAAAAPSTVPTLANGLPSPTPSPESTAGAPSALQCFAWPDGSVTQTFDPQSPPCVATWPGQSKGNGGATSQGITATEIKIAVPQASSGSTFPMLEHIVDFFNTHYELYGRKIVLVPSSNTAAAASTASTANEEDPSAQHADAVNAASLKPFAATDYEDGVNALFTAALPDYLDTLAEHQVITVAGGTLAPITSNLEKHAPYEWSTQPTTDQVLAAGAGLVCRQLKGHVASHSNAYRSTTRKFGVLFPDSASNGGGPVPGQSAFLAALAGCGITNPPVVYFSNAGGSGLSASLVKLRSSGVTSVLFLPTAATGPTAPEGVASTVGYTPEWVTLGTDAHNAADLAIGSGTEARQTFGVAAWSKVPVPSSDPWNEAYLSSGGSSNDQVYGARGLYLDLQLLASGFQMAGPHLTPQTFEAALAGTTFPNPGAGAAPSYQAAVGFSGGRHEMVSDFTAFWLDPSTPESSQVTDGYQQNYEDYEAFCYVGLGARATAATWATTDRFYQAGCR